MKPKELYLIHDTILLNGRIIKAEEIKVIMSMGGFKHPVIGIKPDGVKIVPNSMCFRFMENGEEGFADLTNWAARNKVSVDTTFFIRWI
ncbi:MAG: hypothetical protein K0Q73_3429 [Paenibacillus sp.]|jgi:hypothetical protein|nr:hypothetical protein [Paenibacillus sp.]